MCHGQRDWLMQGPTLGRNGGVDLGINEDRNLVQRLESGRFKRGWGWALGMGSRDFLHRVWIIWKGLLQELMLKDSLCFLEER